MNNIKYSKMNKFLFVLLVTVVGFAGCKKDDGPIKKEILDKINEVPAITINMDPTGSQAIDLINPGDFQGKFTVSEYFPGTDIVPDKVDIVVRRTGSSGQTVKIFKSDITTFPTDLSVNAGEIEDLFGPIELGDSYDFAPDIYYKGQKYEAFPLGGKGTGGSGGPNNMPGYSELVRFSAICAYDPDIYEGDFEVVDDEWGDYEPGDVIEVTRVSDNQFSFEYPIDDAEPIIVTVNTLNNATSVAKQVMGSGYGSDWPYGTMSVESVASNDNLVKPCDETFSVSLKFSVAAGSWTGYAITLKKVH